jgi:hypothetical protein
MILEGAVRLGTPAFSFSTTQQEESNANSDNGITALSGSYYAVMAGNGGPFTKFDSGASGVWQNGLREETWVYVETNWPAGTGIEWTAALSGNRYAWLYSCNVPGGVAFDYQTKAINTQPSKAKGTLFVVL